MAITSLQILSNSLSQSFCTTNRDKHLYPKLYLRVSIFYHENENSLNGLNGILFNYKMHAYYLQIQSRLLSASTLCNQRTIQDSQSVVCALFLQEPWELALRAGAIPVTAKYS